MHRVFRLRHLLILAAALSVGVLPIFAFPGRSMGPTADNFGIIGNVVTASNGNVTYNGDITAGPGFGNANIAANQLVENTGNFISDGVELTAGPPINDAAAQAALAQLSVNGATLFFLGQATGTVISGNFNGANLAPGFYRVVGNASLTTAMTFTGLGDYVIEVDGSFSNTGAMNVAAGANPGNITIIVGTTVTLGANSTTRGRMIAPSNITMGANAFLDGKLLAANGGNVSVTGPTTIVDCGNPPPVTVSNIVGPANVTPTGVDILVCVGSSTSFDISSIDAPDNLPGNIAGQGEVTLDSIGDAGVVGYSENPVLPTGFAAPASTHVTFTPIPAQGGTTIPITYRATDHRGTICDFIVNLVVSNPPIIGSAFNIVGQAPFQSGSGDPGSPIVVCEGGTVSFDIPVTDPDPDPDLIQLQYAIVNGSPAGTLTITSTNFNNTNTQNVPRVNPLQAFPPANATSPQQEPLTVHVVWTPVAADLNKCFTFRLRAFDDAGCITDRDFELYSAGAPQFIYPPTPDDFKTTGHFVTACVGESLHYRVRATSDDIDQDCFDPDADPGVFISVAGVPIGASHDPNFLGVDTLGPFGDDLLTVPAINPALQPTTAETEFEWLPTPGDVGVYNLVYTAEDSFGCTVQTTVNIHVTDKPVFVAPTPAEGSFIHTCVGVPFSAVTIKATDLENTDGIGGQDTVKLSVVGSVPGLNFAPALPTSAAGTVQSVLSGTPTTPGKYTLVFTAQDTDNTPTQPQNSNTLVQCTPLVTRTFTIIVEHAPVFTAPTPADNTTFNLCNGDPLTFRIRATDADVDEFNQADVVTLTVTGALPAGATLTPSLPTSGNPVETVFNLPAAGASGTFPLTFTATDKAGCIATTHVTVFISQKPTITISNITGFAPLTSGDGTQANPIVVCTGATLGFTVTAADSDAGQLVTLNVGAVPANYTHNPALPGAAANPKITQVTFIPNASQENQTFKITYTATDNSASACSITKDVFIRVSSVPTVTITNLTGAGSTFTTNGTVSTLTVCEGKLVHYKVRADEKETGQAIGELTLDSTGDAGIVGYTETPTLPIKGDKTVETDVVFQTPQIPDGGADQQFVINYIATDADGCTHTNTLTINVLENDPGSITLVREGGAAGPVVVGTQVCFIATVKNQCGDPYPGVCVQFSVSGSTGSNTVTPVKVVADANGQARFCYTPCFPGTDTITAFADDNCNGVQDAGDLSATIQLTVTAPTSPGAFASGSGVVDVTGFGTGTVTPATFSLDVRTQRKGSVTGSVNFNINGIKPQFRVQSTKIESLAVTQQPAAGGADAVIFGTAKVTGFPPGLGVFGKGTGGGGGGGTLNLRFRVDAKDRGTPGVGVDSFVISFINPATGNKIPPGELGGLLQFTVTKGVRGDNDIKISGGVPVP